jgi:hypothetical protein
MAAALDKLLKEMRQSPKGVRFADAVKAAELLFGEGRVSGSHHIFKTPWPGDPRVNLQDDGSGKAKVYQVRQLLQAADRKAAMDEGKGQ